MSDYFEFGGYIDENALQRHYVSTMDYNAQVFQRNIETIRPMDYTFKQINGKSGDIIIPSNRFPNREKRFQVLITGENAETNMRTLVSKLLAYNGYQPLWTSFDPDYYYNAVISEPIDIETTRDRDAFKFNITFNCKPQRWLKSGLVAQNGSSSYSLVNPSNNSASPLLVFRGYGSISFFQYGYYNLRRTIQIGNHGMSTSYFIFVDCDTMECYYGLTYNTLPTGNNNLNQYLSVLKNGVTVYDFPVLPSGDTTNDRKTDIDVTTTSTLTDLQVVPRWYEL